MLEQLWLWQKQYQPSDYLLALSGGLDSVVLLHLLLSMRDELTAPLTACHVNHGWHGHAADWAAHCAALCAEYDVPFQTVQLHLPDVPRTSREAQARAARYAALAEVLPEKGVLLTAHHQDDQAETLLLQLLRGAGVSGLAAMPARKAFADGAHWRPLLHASRAALHDYALTHALHWVDDPSNDDVRYARNRLRHEVLPLLNTAFANATPQIARSAAWLAETQELLDEAADSHLAADIDAPLDWQGITSLSDAWQRAIVRRWLQRQGIRPPGHRRLQELLRQLREGSGYAELVYDHWVVLFYQAQLQILPLTEPAPPPPFAVKTNWLGVGRLSLRSGEIGQHDWQWSLYPPSARFQPVGKTYSKSLKHWFQQANIAPYSRRRTPLLWRDGELVWVGGIGAAAIAAGLVIDWQKPLHSDTIPPVLQASD